jgi:hypothetical protein
MSCDVEVWMVGMHQVPHANQDPQINIEAYHDTIKWWLKHDIGRTKAQKVEWLVWRLTNLVLTHCLHAQETNKKRIIQNHNVKKIVKDGILWAHTITKRHLNSPTSIEEPWHVISNESTLGWTKMVCA